MKIRDIVIGDRVLVQSQESQKEVAKIKGINPDNGFVVVRLSNGQLTELHPQYILKSFGE